MTSNPAMLASMQSPCVSFVVAITATAIIIALLWLMVYPKLKRGRK